MLLLNRFTHDTRVLREARTLVGAGHAVRLVALAGPGLPARDDVHGIDVVRVPLRSRAWRGRLAAPFLHFGEFVHRALAAVAAGPPPQVVHAHDANTLWAGRRAARAHGARLLYDAHELETGRNHAARRLVGVHRHLTALPERRCLRDADAVITASPGYARELARTYGIAEPVVVRNCPDWDDGPLDRAAVAAIGAAERSRLGIPPGARVAVTSGGVLPGRGIALFLDAVERLPDVHGVVLGDGPLVPDLAAEAAAGRWSRAHFVPAVPPEHLRDRLAWADVAVALIEDVCASYRLCLPNKLFEGIGAGLPVIVSDLPEMASLVRSAGVGDVVDAGDAAAVAAAIARLVRPGPARDTALAAVARARPLLSWRAEAPRLLEVYARLTHGAP